MAADAPKAVEQDPPQTVEEPNEGSAEEPVEGTVEELVVPPGVWVELARPANAVAVEAALGGGLLRPVGGRLRAPEAGDHWLAVASRDAAGTRSPVRWLRLRVDGTAPRLEVTVEPPPVAAAAEDSRREPWIAPASRAQAKAEDAPAGVAALALEAGANHLMMRAESLSLELPTAGEVELTARAEDAVGNAADAEIRRLRVDARAPTGEVVLEGPTVTRGDRVLAPPSLVVTARVEDGESGVASWTPRIGGEEVSAERWAGPWTAGRYSLDAVAEDRVGNRGALPGVTVEIDDEGPEVAWTFVGAEPHPAGVAPAGKESAGERVYRSPVLVRLTAQDPARVASLHWSPDGSDWRLLELAESPETTTAAVQTHGPGWLRAADGVGNRSRQEVTVRIDDEAPMLRVTGPRGEVPAGELVDLRQGETISITAEDPGSGIAAGEATLVGWLDGRPLPQELSFPTRGRYRLLAWAEDRLGHRAEALWQIHVDRSEEPANRREEEVQP
ncbi:MAG: hypothetical protein SX243_00425 [Acidobacteriota bacterium]|nr:hypothetical protein [Acidobacteriota bacterium]